MFDRRLALQRVSQQHRPVSTKSVALIAVNQRYGKFADTRTHDVPAMPRTVQPAVDNGLQARVSRRDILSNRSPDIAGIGQPISRTGVVFASVIESLGLLHPLTMPLGRQLGFRVPDKCYLSRHNGISTVALHRARLGNALHGFVNKTLVSAGQARAVASAANTRIGLLLDSAGICIVARVVTGRVRTLITATAGRDNNRQKQSRQKAQGSGGIWDDFQSGSSIGNVWRHDRTLLIGMTTGSLRIIKGGSR